LTRVVLTLYSDEAANRLILGSGISPIQQAGILWWFADQNRIN